MVYLGQTPHIGNQFSESVHSVVKGYVDGFHHLIGYPLQARHHLIGYRLQARRNGFTRGVIQVTLALGPTLGPTLGRTLVCGPWGPTQALTTSNSLALGPTLAHRRGGRGVV